MMLVPAVADAASGSRRSGQRAWDDERRSPRERRHPEVIRVAEMMYIRYPLSLRQVEDLLFERGIDICHETIRYWWNRFGPMFAAAIRKRRIHHRSFSQWRWHLDEVFVRINGETHYLWRAVDHEGEVLEVFATKRRDRRAALRFLKRTMKRFLRAGGLEGTRLLAGKHRRLGIGSRIWIPPLQRDYTSIDAGQ
jgi:putative transposase